jgi:hypothetical protein
MIKEVMAMTNRLWMKLPAAYAKVPIAHPVMRITAMMYQLIPAMQFL